MSAILDGLDGVVCLIDDVLVYGKDLTEHDSRHPDKVFAICQLKSSQNVSELYCFLSMATQMSKFAPNLAERTKPLRISLTREANGFEDTPNNKLSKT